MAWKLWIVGATFVATVVPARAQEPIRLVVSASDFEQLPTPAGPVPTPRHTGIKATAQNIVHDFGHLGSRTNLLLAGIGGASALSVHPFDDRVNRHLIGSGASKTIFTPGKYMGQSYTLIGSAFTIYAIGRSRDEPKVSHLGMDLIRALAVDAALTEVLKYSVHRERPDGSNHRSFPSGHASATFAFATALERHLGWRGAVPAYVFSSYVAASRLRDNRHFLSDVVFGATVGIIAGRTVTRHGRDSYTMGVVPVNRGFATMVSNNR